jgi:hypothetical protein
VLRCAVEGPFQNPMLGVTAVTFSCPAPCSRDPDRGTGGHEVVGHVDDSEEAEPVDSDTSIEDNKATACLIVLDLVP